MHSGHGFGWRITIVTLPVFVVTLSPPVPDDGSFAGCVGEPAPPPVAPAVIDGFNPSAVPSAVFARMDPVID